MISIDTAREYFETHLLGEFFLESDSHLMTSAVKMAENDVRSQLSFLPPETDSNYIAAVCEQAVFLLMHKDQLAQKKVVLSESIEGLGSCTYADPRQIIAPRAEIFIENINRICNAAVVNIKRG